MYEGNGIVNTGRNKGNKRVRVRVRDKLRDCQSVELGEPEFPIKQLIYFWRDATASLTVTHGVSSARADISFPFS